MKKALTIGFAIILLIVAGVLYATWSVARHELKTTPIVTEGYATTTLTIGQASIIVDIADTDELRIKGLSGRRMLPDGYGMLFIFPQSDFYGFWMKDMIFPIDIIGLTAQKEVLWLEKNMTPESFPRVFTPPRPVEFVVEVPAGTIDELGVVAGQRVTW